MGREWGQNEGDASQTNLCSGEKGRQSMENDSERIELKMQEIEMD